MDLAVASTGATTYTAGGTNPKHTFNDAFIITNDASSTLSIRRTSGGSIYGTAIAASSTGTTFTCNVDTGVPSTGFVFIPASAWGSGKYFDFQSYAGDHLFWVDVATGTTVYNSSIVSGVAMVDYGNSSSLISSSWYIAANFQAKWGNTVGGTTFAISNAACAGYFGPYDNTTAGTSMTTPIAGGFENNSVATNRNHVSVIGGAFRAISSFNGNTACAHGDVYGWVVKVSVGAKNQTATNYYGGYVEGHTAATPAFTNTYGLYVGEQAQAAATIKNGIFLASATAGYKAIAIRDQNTYFHSSAAATMDVTATQFNVNAYFQHTGTQVGFYNVASVTRPSAYTQTYATATKTHSNLTSATLTDSSGGTANTTVAAVAGSGDDTNINNNFADVTAQINALRVDLVNLKGVVNSVIDDGQALGLLQ